MFVFKRVEPVLKHSAEAQAILDRLESFLAQESPQVVFWVKSFLEEQQNAVTYAELERAMVEGYESYIQKWQEDYAQFVNEKLSPVWMKAIKAGAGELQNKLKELIIDDSDKHIKDWLQQHTAKFITNIGEETRSAIRAIINHGQNEGWSAQRMARAIAPCIGLTRGDALANVRYRETVLENFSKTNPPAVAERLAHEAALRYGAKQHQARAEMIANTELAFAYNRGKHESVRQAMAQGLMGACEKVWSTAGSERVCGHCMALNGKRIGFDESFDIHGRELYSGMHQVPPAHPRCRCVVQYIEYAPPARKPLEVKPKVDTRSTLDAEDFFKDMSVIPNDRYGVCIRSDGSFLENMNLSARREIVDGKEQYCLYGKLTSGIGNDIAKMLFDSKGGEGIYYTFKTMDASATTAYNAEPLPFKATILGVKWKNQFGEFEMVTDENTLALKNFFTVRVPANADAQKAIKNMLDEIYLDDLLLTPDEYDTRWHRMRRLAWSRHPEIDSATLKTMPPDDLVALLAKDGLTEAMINDVRLENVWNGYSTYIDESLAQIARDKDVDSVWSGVGSAETIVAIVKSGGLACTKNRLFAGYAGDGKSMAADIKSGGADGVFTRLGVKNKKSAEYGQCMFSGTYRIKIDPDVLGRTDWYAYDGDKFGRTSPSTLATRKKLEDFIDDMKENYKTGNEIIFRNGIRTDEFIGIVCDTEADRKVLIDAFHQAGVTEVNGISVEQFVYIEKEIGGQ